MAALEKTPLLEMWGGLLGNVASENVYFGTI